MKLFPIAVSFAMLCAVAASAETIEPIAFGNMNQWVTRTMKESAVIGGNTVTVYEIAPTATISGAVAYTNQGGSPWATSNVYAKVAGIVKTSNAVYPHKRATGDYCAKLCTVMEHVKAIGIINLDVLVSGSIFLGEVFEPIRNTSNPYSKMEMGMRYSKRPDYLVFDYKVEVPANGKKIYSSGFGSKKELSGHDYTEVYALLQKRWEDADGNLHALRVGTGRERYGTTTSGWNNSHHMPIYYGDITKSAHYKSYMGLIPSERAYYARNSKGKMVPVVEEGWADEGETPTHVLVMASSGCGVAYEGTVGMTLYIDNISFGFK